MPAASDHVDELDVVNLCLGGGGGGLMLHTWEKGGGRGKGWTKGGLAKCTREE